MARSMLGIAVWLVLAIAALAAPVRGAAPPPTPAPGPPGTLTAAFGPKRLTTNVAGSVKMVPGKAPGEFAVAVDLDFSKSNAKTFCGFGDKEPWSFSYGIADGWKDDVPSGYGTACDVAGASVGHFDPNLACSPWSASAACFSGPNGSIDPTKRVWGRSSVSEYPCGSAKWIKLRDSLMKAKNWAQLFLNASLSQCELGDLSHKWGELKVNKKSGKAKARYTDILYLAAANGAHTPVAPSTLEGKSLIVHCGAGASRNTAPSRTKGGQIFVCAKLTAKPLLGAVGPPPMPAPAPAPMPAPKPGKGDMGKGKGEGKGKGGGGGDGTGI